MPIVVAALNIDTYTQKNDDHTMLPYKLMTISYILFKLVRIDSKRVERGREIKK